MPGDGRWTLLRDWIKRQKGFRTSGYGKHSEHSSSWAPCWEALHGSIRKGRRGVWVCVCSVATAWKFEAAVCVSGPYRTTQAGNDPLCILGGVSQVGKEQNRLIQTRVIAYCNNEKKTQSCISWKTKLSVCVNSAGWSFSKMFFFLFFPKFDFRK